MSENNIISVEAAKVASAQVGKQVSELSTFI
jgi:hypothetical protein